MRAHRDDGIDSPSHEHFRGKADLNQPTTPVNPSKMILLRHSSVRTLEAGYGGRFKWVEYLVIEDRDKGDTWPPSSVDQARGSGRGQAARRGGLPSQPPQHEAMEHQRQRDGEGRDHHQRISVRRVRVEMSACFSRRG